MIDQEMNRAAIPRELPRARPSSSLLEAHEKAWAKDGYGGAPRSVTTRIIRRTALHEAAHAVADWEFGHEVEFVSLFPRGDLEGLARVRRYGHEHLEDLVRSMLAGPIVDFVSSTDMCELEEDDGDISKAVKLLGDRAENRLPELWDETIVLVTHIRIWHAIVRVADELLRRGQLKGSGPRSAHHPNKRGWRCMNTNAASMQLKS